MATIHDLSPAKCVLLAARLAAESDIQSLHQFTPTRQDVFDLPLTLRLLLTYLPETLDPSKYTTYLEETVSRIYLEQLVDSEIDCSSVANLSDEAAQKQRRHLHLLSLEHPSIAGGAVRDPLTLFLIHRAHRIDSETGLLPIIPRLLEPFIARSAYLRDWYISAILPLIRLEFEYYPDSGALTSLHDFERYAGERGTEILLAKTTKSSKEGKATEETVGRDFRGIVAPWVHGGSQRKKRKLGQEGPPAQAPVGLTEEEHASRRVRNPDFAGKMEEWQPAFRWIVKQSVANTRLALQVVEGWDGPSDVDFGGHEHSQNLVNADDELANELRHQYCQAMFASIYAAEQDTSEVIDLAHAALVRLATLMEFDPPPDLATSISLLPQIDKHSEELEDATPEFLRFDSLLNAQNPLTSPKLETFSLLQMFVFSAYQLSRLGRKMSIVNIAKLRFWSDETEQRKVLQSLLHGLVNGTKNDENKWKHYRDSILWLWDWALKEKDELSTHGSGILGKLKRDEVEEDILEAFCNVGDYSLVAEIYLDDIATPPLSREVVEKAIIGVILNHFDNASNGNRTRGGVKKASELLSAFRKYYPDAQSFRSCASLIAAAHALSFYSLTLQRGVPFQPVSIRANEDPVSLIAKVLQQNAHSYTKLDDLIDVGRNIVIGHLVAQTMDTSSRAATPEAILTETRKAEHRVIGMAIEAALAEGDFETAYSYVVNRLTPPPTANGPASPAIATEIEDDISWRAALEAGRHRLPTSASRAQATSSSSASIRRLEQRMELLSQSLLLAPPTALTEVLAAWRKCEEELLTVLEFEADKELEFDDQADRGELRIPGDFSSGASLEPVFSIQPKRKELGRGAMEEAPMGLFDVARGAAAAFSRSAGGLAVQAGKEAEIMQRQLQAQAQKRPGSGDAEERVRKRDMVANVVTGGLASGLGWVLGAPPPPAQGR